MTTEEFFPAFFNAFKISASVDLGGRVINLFSFSLVIGIDVDVSFLTRYLPSSLMAKVLVMR